MNRYRLLALDMDGTLLNSHKQVSSVTAQALAEVTARGAEVAFSTGRNATEVEPYRATLPFMRYGVLVSGGLVYDFVERRTIHLRALSTSLALRIIEVGMEHDAMVHVLTVHHSAARGEDIPRLDELGLGIYRPLFETICTQVKDTADFVRRHDGQVIKINLYHPSAQARAHTEARLNGLPLALVHGESFSLECTVEGISKGEGLRRLAAYLDVDLDEVVMVGDSDNDREALEVVGMPVAMGNAAPQIAALAQLVVADCDHDGVAEAARLLFL